jgi:hypothetical protein
LYIFICQWKQMHVHRKEMYIHESKCGFLKKVFALRERPFNLKGGGYGFFVFFKYSDSQCCWKKYSDFGGGKKK